MQKSAMIPELLCALCIPPPSAKRRRVIIGKEKQETAAMIF
jgi:hypothetical protein